MREETSWEGLAALARVLERLGRGVRRGFCGSPSFSIQYQHLHDALATRDLVPLDSLYMPRRQGHLLSRYEAISRSRRVLLDEVTP